MSVLLLTATKKTKQKKRFADDQKYNLSGCQPHRWNAAVVMILMIKMRDWPVKI